MASPVFNPAFNYIPIMVATNAARELDADELYVKGNLKIWLKGAEIVAPERGSAGWLAERLGLFRKEAEFMYISQFADTLAKMLLDAGIKNVMLAEIDHDEVYNDEGDEKPYDLLTAIERIKRRARDMARSEENLFGANKLFISLAAYYAGLQCFIEISYHRVHGLDKPSIEVHVTGVPDALTRHPKEDEKKSEERIENLVGQLNDDEDELDKFTTQQHDYMANALTSIISNFQKFFSVKSIEKSIEMDV